MSEQSIYWLGGSPCAGKSSVAHLLADRYDLQVVHVDDGLARHLPHLTPTAQPMLHKWTHTPWDTLWSLPAAQMLAETMAAYAEHCALVHQDVAELTTTQRILVEGTCLLPACIHPYLATPQHGLWVVPTEEFQRTHYPARGAWVQTVLSQCRDPDAALAQWMARDVAFARWVMQETQSRDLALVVVDGSLSVEEVAMQVAAQFGWEP
jgi:2-phosphoglycerate kinase